MKIEKAIELLEKVANEYKTYGDLDNPEFEDIKKIAEAIKTVLQELKSYKRRYELAIEQNIKDYKNSIPKKKIENEIEELRNMNVEGELFTTVVNYAILILQELLNK